jgi:hypothetical protein
MQIAQFPTTRRAIVLFKSFASTTPFLFVISFFFFIRTPIPLSNEINETIYSHCPRLCLDGFSRFYIFQLFFFYFFFFGPGKKGIFETMAECGKGALGIWDDNGHRIKAGATLTKKLYFPSHSTNKLVPSLLYLFL